MMCMYKQMTNITRAKKMKKIQANMTKVTVLMEQMITRTYNKYKKTPTTSRFSIQI